MNKLSFIILLIGVITLGSCATLQQVIQKPIVEFDSMSLRDMSLFEGTAVFKFEVTNPNPIGLTLNSLSYNLKIDDGDFVKGVLDKDLTLAAKDSNHIELPITIKYLDFFDSVSELIKKDHVTYDLSGIFEFFGFDIPYHKSGDIQIPDLPKISMDSVDIKDISLTGASIVFALSLDNQNAFPVDISGLDYSIKLCAIEFAGGKSQSSINIGKNGRTTIKVPVNLNFLQMGLAAYNLLAKSSSEYNLTGNIKINVPNLGEKSLPFSKIGDVTFIRK